MSGLNTNEPMLDMYIFETSQYIEQLETIILSCEKTNSYSEEAINEIFRIMHSIKGSSAMMLFNNISTLAHSIEDLFFFLRERKPSHVNTSTLSDLVFEAVDFIKVELQKIKAGDKVDGESAIHIGNIKEFLEILKKQNPAAGEIPKPDSEGKEQYYITSVKGTSSEEGNIYKAVLFFEENCGMENMRAYSIIHNLKEITEDIYFIPEDILENESSEEIIKSQGFTVYVKTNKSFSEMNEFFMQTILLKDMELQLLGKDENFWPVHKAAAARLIEESPIKVPVIKNSEAKEHIESTSSSVNVNKSIISVNVDKLDKLMDLVGEMVIAEAMVTQNPDLKGFELENFYKAARHLNKITSEIQDAVMSIRMVPLSSTFQKMHRLVRDMSKKLEKEVVLNLIGEETEVDKNIIEHISDPLMHLIRNAIDHGIDTAQEREANGKPKVGTITLEAKNAGSDVVIIVKDDGKGLNREKILQKARENDLLTKSEEEMSDREIYNLILLPGFSTKDIISEFSGRGVGMDVVTKNLEIIGGAVSVDSVWGSGTTITLKIPLTLAIIDGMNVKVGNSYYTIPIITIKESFRPKKTDLITDPDGNEMIMVRGECYPILRLYEHFVVETEITDFGEGILIMVEQDEKSLCLFADQLVGQQQVVVKTLPNYIKNTKKISGLAGCTLLGDGNISLILDIGKLINKRNSN